MATRKKTVSSARKEPAKRGLAAEVTGLFLIFLALFAFLSLVSYSPRDPSWASAAAAGQGVHNYGGRIGASFAEGLLQGFGAVAFLLPFICGYLGLRSALASGRRRAFLRLGLGLLFILLLCPLAALLLQRVPWHGAEFPAGGIAGDLIADLLHGYLNTAGSLAVLLAALVLFLLFSTRWSLAKTLRFSRRAFRSAFKDVRIKVTSYQASREREKMRQRVLEKYATPLPAGPPKPAPPDKKAEKEKRKQEKAWEKERRRQEKMERREAQKAPPPGRPGKEPILVTRPAAAAKPAAVPPPEKLLFPDLGKRGEYHFPPFTLLDPGQPADAIDKNELLEKKQRIEEKLREFGVEGLVKEYHPGPVITTYEFYPAPGVKVSQVANLTEELSLALQAESVRIQRIPGKASLGVEIPNNKRETIKLRDIVQSEKFLKAPSKLTFALGKSVHGEVTLTDLDIMPHLLIAGATGTGKSVALNALIASILYKATPEEVKLILIDPKRLEFTLYDGIPHLLAPVINDPKKAGTILMDAVRKMEERYRRLSASKVRNIEQYNQLVRQALKEKKGRLTEAEKESLRPLPYLVIIIDELAELMMVGAQDVEFCIARLAQLARAVGIHLVMATQRPSIDVITGTIKNNFACRIAFRVPSKIDSRIIIDTVGAEKLLGLGDMLFLPPNYPRLVRLHCAYISIPEVQRLVKFVKEQGTPVYDERIVQVIKGDAGLVWDEGGEKDELYEKAMELVLLTGQASASYLQRKMKLGYARAARIIDQMEQEGIVGPTEGSKPREILVNPREYLKELERTKKAAG
jgi:DNA segregation ATPase FtsK/SpoIIIE, S-DNA-T family